MLSLPAMSEANGNGSNGKAANGKHYPHQLKPFMWKKGHTGNPNGRPRGASIRSALERILSEHDGTRLRADIIAQRIYEIAKAGEDRDAIKAVELCRKAIDGDRLTVTEIEGAEWATDDAEITSPVPAPLGANRLPQRSGDS